VSRGATTLLDPRSLETAEEVAELARSLWGELPAAEGVVHVTALAGPPGAPLSELSTLAIDAHSPKSDYDAFALCFARAGADAIVITGQILRDEPQLHYSLGGLGLPEAPLLAYRRSTGRRAPPELYILTSGRGLEPEHPALHGWPRAHLVVPRGARLPEAELRCLGVVIERERRPDPRALVRRLRSEGARRVLVEVGPSTSRALYEAPALVDELLLSIYEGDEPTRRVGTLAPGALALSPWAPSTRPEPGWSFQLLGRAGTSDPT